MIVAAKAPCCAVKRNMIVAFAPAMPFYGPAGGERFQCLRNHSAVLTAVGNDAAAIGNDAIMAKNPAETDGHNITGHEVILIDHR